MELQAVPAISVDMRHFEKMIGRKIGGLIGFDLIKNYELYIDYGQKIIRMYPNAQKGLHRNKTPLSSFSFEMQDHIPVIKAQIGNRIYRLGLDTGAEINVLNAQLKKDLANEIQKYSPSNELLDLNSQFSDLEKIQIGMTQIGAIKYREMEYLFVDLSKVNESVDTNLALDGILGYPFFSTCTLSINFDTQQVSIWNVN